MSELTEKICSIRLKQKDTPELLPPVQIDKWIQKAESRIQQLKDMRPDPDSDDYIECDCLISNLDEIQERRADLIWDLARYGLGDTSLMTPQEAMIYQNLVSLAEQLRGEAA